MELTKYLSVLAMVLPIVYGAPTETANNLHPEVLAAMKRDLGLDAAQANARVARELKATETIEQLQTLAGSAFAGAWVSEDGAINVGITDEALAAEVSAAGATPAVLANSLSKLQEAKEALDKIHLDKADETARIAAVEGGVAAYYVDITTNKLVLEATEAGIAQAEALAGQVGLSESEFEVRKVDSMPTPFATVGGGDPYYISGGRCSVGFAVTTGFVSAGHCGRSGASATTSGGTLLGTFAGSVFPGSADMSYIRGASATTYRNSIAGSGQTITGSTAAAVGSSICRSGSTTGVHCGAVQALGATVNYQEGSVTGLTRTSVCAEPGDSGGPFYSGAQAQGVTSGGSGNCNSGGTTYFQPVNEILQTYGLTLYR